MRRRRRRRPDGILLLLLLAAAPIASAMTVAVVTATILPPLEPPPPPTAPTVQASPESVDVVTGGRVDITAIIRDLNAVAPLHHGGVGRPHAAPLARPIQGPSIPATCTRRLAIALSSSP